MPSSWMPGAKIVRGNTDGGSMTGGERLVTWHYYVAPLTMSPVAGAKYLNETRKQVHFLFNVLTGEWVQMLPVTRAGRGLRNEAGGVQTNRRGTYNIQIEVMANSPHWWKNLTPAGKAGLARGMAYFRSLGIPDVWAGKPGATGDTPNGRSGHTGHNNWVENDHGDYLSRAPWELVGGTAAAATPTRGSLRQQSKPVAVTGKFDAELVTLWQRYLVQVGGASIGIDGQLGPRTISAWQAYMAQKLGIKGLGKADGIAGPATARATEQALGLPAATVAGFYPGIARGLAKALNTWVTKGTEIRR